MKLISIIVKGLREQIRSFWILLLTISMGPLFIFVYFLITESSKPQYNIRIVNADKGISVNGQDTNHGENLTFFFTTANIDTSSTLHY